MKSKKMIGWIALIAGCAAIALSIYGFSRIKGAQGSADTLSSAFSGSTGGKVAKGMIDEKIMSVKHQVQLLLIGGIVLAAIGSVLLVAPKKKKK